MKCNDMYFSRGRDVLYEYMVNKTVSALAPKLGCEPNSPTYDKLKYGTHVFYINAVKSLLLIIVALVLGILPYVAVFALVYGALRIYSFGVHLNNSLLCTVIGFVYYLGSVYLSLYAEVPLWARVALLAVSTMGFVVYAPAQTKKRPIPARQRKILKKKSLVILAVVAVAVFILHHLSPVFSSLILMAAVCQTVNLLPSTYRIFKED